MKSLLRKEHFLTLAMLIGAAVTILSASFTAFAEDCEQYPEKLFRLHILANSDNEADQTLKYALRDYLMTDFAYIFEDCSSVDEAKAAAKENLSEIATKAREFVAASGYDYKIAASVEKTYFNTRKYNNITVPAGEYESLRIVIGDGAGKNWWCVMFPPLCLSAAEDVIELKDSDLQEISTFLFSKKILKNPKPVTFSTAESIKIEAGDGVDVRFAVYEWLCSLFS